ncbi:hypothetical protein MesoLj131b_77410 (plasmid) [Mesorhizobium sp. 131-2-5]|uniref:hypothetical protein n=1 Tax=Mesorhizobium sp. 131-2-5 TaxID=2744519 RepID=UPI0018EB214A|nr:hypothetical protein [Mesorhizobium sp. 131-2-5]BCH05742.1 hypothetical protein MesoLj131b_77410 [Mesorhizobium sp. 131-2-5]
MAKLLIASGIATITFGVFATASPTFASAFCDARVASYRGELEAKAGPAIAQIDNGIAELRSGGGDPDQVGFKMADGTFKTLPEIRALLLTQKAAVLNEIDAAGADCTKELKPYQDAVDAGMTIATGGLNKILPERMTHIEIGEILAGKPFGGDGALIPHFREQLLGALGLAHDRGFVTKFIRDPVHAIFPHW